MVTTDDVRKWALAMPGVTEEPHFERTSFRIDKRIFATMDPTSGLVVLKLSEMDQSLFCTFDETVMYPVRNKWGRKGWTEVMMKTIPEKTFKEALKAAYDVTLIKG